MENLEVYPTKCGVIKVQSDGFCAECQSYHWKFVIVREKVNNMTLNNRHRAYHAIPGTNRIIKMVHGKMPSGHVLATEVQGKFRPTLAHLEEAIENIVIAEIGEDFLWVNGKTSRYNPERHRVHISADAVESTWNDGNVEIASVIKLCEKEGWGEHIGASEDTGVIAHIVHQIAHYQAVEMGDTEPHGDLFKSTFLNLLEKYIFETL